MKHYRIEYQRHATTGLLAATSPDLQGFLVVAKSIDDLLEDIPAVAADIICKQTGEKVAVAWAEQKASDSGFVPLASEVEARRAA